MTQQRTISPSTHGLGFVLAIVTIIGLMFPFIFAYIDRDSSWLSVRQELLFTPLRALLITLMTYAVVKLVERTPASRWPLWVRHFVQLLFILPLMLGILHAFYLWVDLPLSCPDCPPDTDTWQYRRHVGLYFFGTIFIYAFVTGVDYYAMAQQRAAEAEKLQQEFAQVRLQALKSQVNPHFLFNSLSVLSELVQVDPQLSEQFIMQLSKAYRYILDQKDAALVTLQDELEFLDAYFFLLQIRFGRKIALDRQIEVDAAQWQLPPLTLQLLVENAVKHNKMSSLEPLQISITANPGRLEASNPIRLRDQQEASTGIGLENIRKRVAYVSDQPVRITHASGTFSVSIPLVPLTHNR